LYRKLLGPLGPAVVEVRLYEPGGGIPFKPSSPYWSYTARFSGSLSTWQNHTKLVRRANKYNNSWTKYFSH
jgi:hypothetical protein